MADDDNRSLARGYISKYVSKAYDKLPGWVQLVLGIGAIAGIVYYTVREGIGSCLDGYAMTERI